MNNEQKLTRRFINLVSRCRSQPSTTTLYPKGQPIEEITDDELIQINWYLNSRPLKCLNWRTLIEIFLRNLRH